MKILALETDLAKLNASLLSKDEKIVLMVQYHALLFFFRFLQALVVSVVLGFIVWMGLSAGIPLGMLLTIVLIAWAVLVLRPLLRGFIDWKFDELLVTTEKVILVNQSSVIRQEIRQMNLENIASVNFRTQFWNIFPFGEVYLELKEGTGKSVRLRYLPEAHRVSAVASDVLVHYRRRQNEQP